jgi:hypothetical protein
MVPPEGVADVRRPGRKDQGLTAGTYLRRNEEARAEMTQTPQSMRPLSLLDSPSRTVVSGSSPLVGSSFFLQNL